MRIATRRQRILRLCLIALLALFLALTLIRVKDSLRQTLEYAPAPIDNPLKGLVPYESDVRSLFPHSMEFNYLPYSAIVKGYDQFDWQPLEKILDSIASRGHQTVFRIYLEYPDKKGVIPEFLLKDGLKVHKYLNTNTQPQPPSQVETPDYQDKNLRRSLKSFIAALGKKYDGDSRIGFITAGLLGTWGEWHTYPRTELFASKVVQTEVMDAYTAAFKITPILLRYPIGDEDIKKAANHQRKFGYHDDSFAWFTLNTGKKDDDWFYMPSLKIAGAEAETKWQIAPIGGEIRPEAWGEVFDEQPQHQEIQNFRKCVDETHATWLMDSGMFKPNQQPERIVRAKSEVQRMGYEFYVPTANISAVKDGKLSVSVELINRGLAPFYYNWPIQFGSISGRKVNKTFPGKGKLTGLLPGDSARKWDEMLDLKGLKSGNYQLAVQVPNPLPNGNPMRFANESQDADVPGWLTLGEFDVP
jgi:hypothetical protein